MNAIQYALPFLGDATEQHDMARRSPVTAEEMRTVPDGVRLCRFVADAECVKCNFGPFDHTVSWKYHTKVCLKDLARHGLWRPEDEPWYRLQKEHEDREKRTERAKHTYRIQHMPSNLWADIEADSVEEAVQKAGRNHVKIPGGAEWRVEDCWVRQNTGKGWGKPRREHA